ncbi:hypothetical protein PMAYCL1PPCAC_22840, partial [Pristionchus mayeri]
LLDGLLDELLDESLVGDVTQHFQDSSWVHTGFEAELEANLERFRVSASDGELGSCLREQLRRSSTDETRRTGNNDNFAGEERLIHVNR